MVMLLMPIRPEHVNNIFAGMKKFEFRKTKCRRKIDGILIYATSPVKRIVGEAEVTNIVVGSPTSVWEQTSHSAGIGRHYFNQYYQDRHIAVAYALGEVIKYTQPLKLNDFGLKYAPQSYAYIEI